MNAVVERFGMYEFGDFRLNCRTRVLEHRDGTRIPLASKAFDTLAYLVEHVGTVVHKDELMRAVWPDTAVEENNLNQNISILRRALGEGRGDHRCIVTIPSRGYQFVARVRTTAADQRSREIAIAVLPFANVSDDPDFEYFGDGLAEELITALSRLRGVRVAARTSAFSFKGRQVEAREIANLLRVGMVLEGSVRKSGSRLRVTAQLINAADGYHLWADRYDREIEMRDLFDVQDEIAAAVLDALKVNLPGSERAQVFRHRTANVNAHELYLKGRFHLFRMTQSGIETGLGLLEQAIEADSSYALAHVGVAHAYRMFGPSLEMPPGEVGPRAIAAARKAVQIDDTLAEAHAVLAFNTFWYEWAWDVAERHFKRALELDPNSADTHWMYAHLPSNMGRHAEALTAIARARAIDPLSGLINAMEGQFLLHAGRVDEAIARLREATDLDPRSRIAHLFTASAYIENGRFEDAIAEAAAAQRLTPINTQGRALEAYAHARLDNRAAAVGALNELLELSKHRFVSPYHIAIIYAGLEELDAAVSWLERGYEVRDPKMVFIDAEPKWKVLRRLPRFVGLLNKMNLG
jgi:TolB-like protein/Tfp pilus assembly protein PilF